MEITRSKSFTSFIAPLYLAISITLLVITILVPKGNDVLWINGHHTAVFDIFFRLITNLGDGLVFLPVVLVLLFVKFYHSILATVVWIAHGVFCSVVKRSFFPDMKRPKAVLDHDLLYFVPNVDVHSNFSFPSGHTATAFCLAVFLSLLIKNRIATVLLLVMALLVGYSRIYLLQHFLMDVTAGAIIGSGIAFLCWHLFEQANRPTWMNQSIRFKQRYRKASL